MFKSLFVKHSNFLLITTLVLSLVSFLLVILVLYLCIQRARRKKIKEIVEKIESFTEEEIAKQEKAEKDTIKSSIEFDYKGSQEISSDNSIDFSIDRKTSTESISSNYFDKIQKNVFQAVNSQYLAANLKNLSSKNKKSASKEQYRIYTTDLNEISQNGIFMISPMEARTESSESLGLGRPKKADKKPKKRNGFFRRKKKVKRISSQNELNAWQSESIKKKFLVIFNMLPFQQKHFLGFFGAGQNPILKARQNFKDKFQKKKDQSNEDQKSFSSNESSIIHEELDAKIKDFLNHPKINQALLTVDSSGLGRSGVIKLRHLKYTHSRDHTKIDSSEANKRDEAFPAIDFFLYDLHQKNENEPVKKSIKNDQNKLGLK